MRIGQRERLGEVGERVLREKVPLTGGEQLGLLGEVVVDGEPLDAGAACDLGDGRAGRPHLLMERDGRLDDPLSRLPLARGARLELVLALLG